MALTKEQYKKTSELKDLTHDQLVSFVKALNGQMQATRHLTKELQRELREARRKEWRDMRREMIEMKALMKEFKKEFDQLRKEREAYGTTEKE